MSQPMNKLDDKICESLEREASAIDAQTASKLNQARQSALAQLDKPSHPRTGWILTAGGGAVAAAILVMLLSPNANEPSAAPVLQAVSGQVEDWEMLSEPTELALLDELDFYLWVGAQLGDKEDDPLG